MISLPSSPLPESCPGSSRASIASLAILFLAGGGSEAADSEAVRRHYLAEAQRFFRPEFFNRIDFVIPFRNLAPDDIRRIVEIGGRWFSASNFGLKVHDPSRGFAETKRLEFKDAQAQCQQIVENQ